MSVRITDQTNCNTKIFQDLQVGEAFKSPAGHICIKFKACGDNNSVNCYCLSTNEALLFGSHLLVTPVNLEVVVTR